MEKSTMSGCGGPRNGSAHSLDFATLRRGLRLSLAEAALSGTMTALVTGVFLTGFGLALGASQVQIGVLAALPTLANVTQIVGSYLIERTGRCKRLCLWSLAFARASWFAIAIVPLLARGTPGRTVAWWVVMLLAGSSALAAIGGVAWLSWVKDLVPHTVRADFFSRRNQISTGLSLSLSIVAGLFLDWWGLHWPGSIGGFSLVFGFAAVCGLAAMPFLKVMPEPAQTDRGEQERFSRLIALPLRDANFRRLVWFYAYWNLAVNVASPFFNVYMLRELELPFWFATVVTTLAGVASLVANRFWVRLSDLFGNKPTVFLATLGNAFFPLCWLFVSRDWAWLLLPMHLLGMFGSVLVLGPNNIMLKLAPDRNSSAYLAVFNAIVGPVTALAPMLGGVLLGLLHDVHWSVGPVAIGGMKFVFLLSFVGRLSSLFLLRPIREPGAEPVRHVLHTLRDATRFRAIIRRPVGADVRADAPHPPRRLPVPHVAANTSLTGSVACASGLGNANPSLNGSDEGS